MISKTIRFWDLIDSKNRLVWCVAIVMVILSTVAYIYQHQKIWLISSLAGVFIYYTSMISTYKRLSTQEVKPETREVNDI